jgi:rubrerythrin
MDFNSVDEILDFAIRKEQEAHDFYTDIANKAKREPIKQVFLGYALEELGHKAKLEAVKGGQQMLSSEQKVMDLQLGDALVDIEVAPDLKYQDALILAMKAEKNAFVLYTSLAEAAPNAAVRDLFLGLAQEEAKHKLRFELEYDEYVLTDN